jgi:hypothetical protein
LVFLQKLYERGQLYEVIIVAREERRIKANFSDFRLEPLSPLTRTERVHEYLTQRATPDMDYRGQRGVFQVFASYAVDNVTSSRIIGTFEGLFDDILAMAVSVEEFWPFGSMSHPRYSGYIQKLDIIQVQAGGLPMPALGGAN